MNFNADKFGTNFFTSLFAFALFNVVLITLYVLLAVNKQFILLHLILSLFVNLYFFYIPFYFSSLRKEVNSVFLYIAAVMLLIAFYYVIGLNIIKMMFAYLDPSTPFMI